VERALNYLNGYVYFSNPKSFNDPFELKATIKAPTKSDIHSILEGKPETQHPRYKTIERRVKNNVRLQFARESATIATDEWLNEIGILCLAESPKNLLMWAHYGSNHTGMCIGFDRAEKPFSTMKKVKYGIIRPSLPFEVYKYLAQEHIENILFHKSTEWEYESEWRGIKRIIRENEKQYYKEVLAKDPEKIDEIVEVLSENGGPGNYDYNTDAIRRIYFGCRIKDENKVTILNHIRSNELKPKLYQFSIDTKHYDLTTSKLQT
jgi:hypothetical protein